jgi:hypothetical protein
MVSRSALISKLKGSGVKGSLSKMNKSKLLELHKELEKSVLDSGSSLQLMSGASVNNPPQKGEISLAPEGQLTGGAHVSAPKTQKLGAYREFVRANLKKHGGDMSAVAAAYRQQGGGKRPASQAANRAKKKPALGLLHKKNPLQGELPERAAPHAQDIYTYPFDVLTHPVFDEENLQGSTIREHVANIQRGSGHCGCDSCDMRGKGHDAHGRFMDSTHDYCRQFFKGGDYWDTHEYQKGSGLFGSIGHWFKKAAHTVQSIPLVRDAEHGLVKVGSKVLQSALEAPIDELADGAVSLVGVPELAPLIDAGVHKAGSMLQSKASDWVNKKIDQSGQGMYLTV